MRTPRTIGPLTIYSWGWEISFFRKLWLVLSREDGYRHLYVSNDATPPWDQNWGFTVRVWRNG